MVEGFLFFSPCMVSQTSRPVEGLELKVRASGFLLGASTAPRLTQSHRRRGALAPVFLMHLMHKQATRQLDR